jgi:hypothetical protein
VLPNILKNLIYILTYLVLGAVYSQENSNSECGLFGENERWKPELSKVISKTGRIELIKQKILADPIYTETKPVINSSHGRINGHEDKYGNYCGCKILFY